MPVHLPKLANGSIQRSCALSVNTSISAWQVKLIFLPESKTQARMVQLLTLELVVGSMRLLLVSFREKAVRYLPTIVVLYHDGLRRIYI